MGDMFRPCLGHHQALVKNKLTHKMQNEIPIAYKVCEVKSDKIKYLDVQK
jgi:hypothetical protein